MNHPNLEDGIHINPQRITNHNHFLKVILMQIITMKLFPQIDKNCAVKTWKQTCEKSAITIIIQNSIMHKCHKYS